MEASSSWLILMPKVIWCCRLKTNLKVDAGKPNVGRRRIPSLLLLIHGHGHKPHYDQRLGAQRREEGAAREICCVSSSFWWEGGDGALWFYNTTHHWKAAPYKEDWTVPAPVQHDDLPHLLRNDLGRRMWRVWHTLLMAHHWMKLWLMNRIAPLLCSNAMNVDFCNPNCALATSVVIGGRVQHPWIQSHSRACMEHLQRLQQHLGLLLQRRGHLLSVWHVGLAWGTGGAFYNCWCGAEGNIMSYGV